MDILRPEITGPGDLDFTKLVETRTGQEVIPVVVVDGLDAVRAIRMVAFQTVGAVEATLATRLGTFYSRSQGGLWIKGGTSGNTLDVVAAIPDCDNDSLVLAVNPNGPTCHTGADSCFGVAESGIM